MAKRRKRNAAPAADPALPVPVTAGEPADAVVAGEAGGTLISHLIELRNRTMKAILAVIVVFLALVYFANDIYSLLANPLLAAMPKGATMIATEVASPFLTPLRLTALVSLVAAMPFVLYQIWAFIAPGLYRHEKRLAVPLLVSSVLLFYAGMAFAYFVVFPAVFGFLVSTTPAGVTMMTDIKAYLDFVLSLFLAFGIAFEVPVAVIILVAMGVVRPETLAEKRGYVIIGIFVVAAILTPPDVLSQLLLAFPMWFLYEIGLLLSRYLVRQRERAGTDERE
jgi:sec-independent protein translocase protein TatC